MCEIIEFPVKAALERHPPTLKAHSAHEQPVLRFFFRGPDGLVHRGTIHTTLDMNHLDLTDQQRKDYCRGIADSVRAVGFDLLEIYTLGSLFMEIGEPSAEATWLMDMEQALAQEVG